LPPPPLPANAACTRAFCAARLAPFRCRNKNPKGYCSCVCTAQNHYRQYFRELSTSLSSSATQFSV
jgi:hypothetical protein